MRHRAPDARPPPPAEIAVDDPRVREMVDVGFEAEQSRRRLMQAGGNVDLALEAMFAEQVELGINLDLDVFGTDSDEEGSVLARQAT